MDLFKCVMEKLERHNDIINVNECEFKMENKEYTFELFDKKISENTKLIYNSYCYFKLSWQSKINNDKGFVYFVPYSKLFTEHENLCSEITDIENDVIEDQDRVIDDIYHWYPIFLFPNGDKFCFDDRTGQIRFFEHDVFDSGINLHGIVIASSIDLLFIYWSKILFIDIYDWFEGVDDNGIDIDNEIFNFVRQL